MEKDIKKLIEEIDALTEVDLVDEFDQPVAEIKEISTTEILDAKTKVSRALDTLRVAIEDFQNAIIEEVNIIEDSRLQHCVDDIHEIVGKIDSILVGETSDEEAEPVEEAPVEETPAVEEPIESEESDELELPAEIVPPEQEMGIEDIYANMQDEEEVL